MKLEGVYSVLPTPFTAAGDLDLESLKRVVDLFIGAGVNGLTALGVTSEAQTAAAVLGHNFPESVWYKDAYALLQGGGLQPHEDQGSWISKAFHLS